MLHANRCRQGPPQTGEGLFLFAQVDEMYVLVDFTSDPMALDAVVVQVRYLLAMVFRMSCVNVRDAPVPSGVPLLL